MPASTDAEHLPCCPAAVSMPGLRDECRCTELATLFDVPTREECFGEPDPARARARWAASLAEANRRYQELVHELAADEREAMNRYRAAAEGAQILAEDIHKARELLARMLAERGLPDPLSRSARSP